MARELGVGTDGQNALDMIGSLQLQYNRGRQAVITNELIDIITVSGWLGVICGRWNSADGPGCFGFVNSVDASWGVRNQIKRMHPCGQDQSYVGLGLQLTGHRRGFWFAVYSLGVARTRGG